MPRILGYGAGFAVIMTVFDYTGGSLFGKRTEVPGMDEYERKEYLRKNRRRPIEDTIADIGEGRGKYLPTNHLRRSTRTLHLLTSLYRNRTPWLRRTTTREAEGEIWRRHQACLDARRINWSTYNRLMNSELYICNWMSRVTYRNICQLV